jgi:D-glycero-alpha-D-manno-heptose-7-phosphate kinase
MRYSARAPLRIDFGGGWTDVDEYAQTHGGAVLNAAITIYARGTIERSSSARLPLLGPRGRSAVSYAVNVPPGSGLGSSAAQTVLWVTLVKTTIANTSDRREIADIACQISRLLGIVGGRQDEYASALGGISYFTFGDTVGIEQLRLAPDLVQELRSRLVLVYTGQSRLSGSVHDLVWERYRRDDPSILAALARLRSLAGDMKDALLARDLPSFADLINENWAAQTRLHPAVSAQGVDDVVNTGLRSGAVAAKACGAGGGGCVIFLARPGETETLRQAMTGRRLRVLDFDFDSYGVHLNKA